MNEDEFFPEIVKRLPAANIPIDGVQSYLFQGEHQQVIFMSFAKDVTVPEHTHEAQWGVVLQGTMEIVIDGVEQTLSKGDSYFIGKDVKHSAKIFAGYRDLTFFDQRDRYAVLK